MRISPIYNFTPGIYTNQNKLKNNNASQNIQNNVSTNKLPASYTYGQISFGEHFNPNRTVPHIDYEEYMDMKESAKQLNRLKYEKFSTNKFIDKNELVDQKYLYLPLRDEKQMDSFIEVAKMYSKYKDHPIICLGRSPKWFLNAALWMKDGIPDYKYVAFSSYWYNKSRNGEIRKMDALAPTEKEEAAYRRYLKSIKADPKTIVDNFKKTGKTTIITDYICSGKGACSFFEIMAKYAKDLGILEDFSKSIEIVGIGNMQYQENFYYDDEDIPVPRVTMPEILWDYDKNIKQTYYDIKDYRLFDEMLINQNTNECRSTYYPPYAWTIYKPDQFKTGMIHDMKKVKELTRQLKKDKDGNKKHMSHFTPAMYDYRNLLNFRILDGLYQRGLLKENHKSKT